MPKASSVPYLLYFNSIKVQLKHVVAMTSSNSGQFQFHKGAIKTERERGQYNLCSLFQFHKGAIKTVGGVEMRLSAFLFQFHKGAIKTSKPGRSAQMIINFNSIKVQLKQA